MKSIRLRIGFFSDTYLPNVNGVAISLHLLVQSLRTAGHEVTIFAPRFPGYHDREDGVCRIPSVRFVDNPPLYLALPTPQITRSLNRRQFDVLHIHTPLTAGMMAFAAARVKNLPLIYTYQTLLVHYAHYISPLGQTQLVSRMTHWFSTITCNLSDYIVAPSDKVRRLLLEQGVCRPIHMIPNGINLAQFSRSTTRGVYRRLLGLNPRAPLLLFVGRLGPEKQPDFLIESFALVAREHSDAHLLIAGDGQSRPALEKQALASGYGQRIVFLGTVDRDQLPNLLHDVDLFLSTSTTEVHPLAVIEAIASGLPIVAVWDEALEGMLVDGVNGRVVPREVGPFSDAAISLLANPPTLQAFGRASLRFSRKYSVQAQVTAIVQLYEEAIVNHSLLQ